MNLCRNEEGVKKFVMSKRCAKAAADLLGVKNVHLYQDEALFKEPGGGHTPRHQEQYYWHIDTIKTITMWMPLVDITIDMGMLAFVSGSFKGGINYNNEIITVRYNLYKKLEI